MKRVIVVGSGAGGATVAKMLQRIFYRYGMNVGGTTNERKVLNSKRRYNKI